MKPKVHSLKRSTNWQTEKDVKEKVQIIKIKKWNNTTTDLTGIKGIISKYYKLYTNKLDNLKEMNKFFETYKLPKLIQLEIKSEQTCNK